MGAFGHCPRDRGPAYTRDRVPMVVGSRPLGRLKMGIGGSVEQSTVLEPTDDEAA